MVVSYVLPMARVQKIVEERDTTSEEAAITLVNGGIMAARTPLLFDLLYSVETSNAQNEIYLTDIVSVGLQPRLFHRLRGNRWG